MRHPSTYEVVTRNALPGCNTLLGAGAISAHHQFSHPSVMEGRARFTTPQPAALQPGAVQSDSALRAQSVTRVAQARKH